MKPRRTLSAYVLLIGIMGLSIVGGVLAFQIFSASTKTQVTAEQNILIKALDGQIDQKVMTNLQQRTVFTDSQLSEQSRQVTAPVATSGGNINVAPVNGATLEATTQ